MSEPPVVAQTVGVFRAFATLAVFLVLRNPQPLRLDTLLAGIRQSTGRAVLESDVALFRGILGARTIDLHWAAAATDSDSDNQDKDGDSPCLFVSLSLARDPDPPAKRPSKRQRKTVAPQPVLLVKQLVDRFSKSLRERISTHQDGDGAAALIDRIARENLPPRPSPPASGLQGAEPAASSVPHLLATLKSSRFYADQLLDAAATTVPAKPASYQALSADIDPAIWSALSIDQLYSHQAQAISAAMQGRSLVLSTSTASGKSTAYQVPLLQRLLDDPQST
ncbi:ATP-dependent 3'-5' DNA helicase, partial [Coemansia sp. RSA 2599]